MAPDKIYIPQHNIDAGSIQELCELIVEGSVQYIRKDALLVFLNERRNGLTSGDSFVAGERKMIKEIIEKIESL